MDVDSSEVEQWLLMAASDNPEAIDAATEPILELIKSNIALDILSELVVESSDPLVRRSASIYFAQALDIYLHTLSPPRLRRLGLFLCNLLHLPIQDELIARNAAHCLKLIMSKRNYQWPELFDFFDSFDDPLTPIIFRLLGQLIVFFPNDYISERYHVLLARSYAGVQSRDWALVIPALQLGRHLSIV
jgi:hypothetical protein